jgi:hypothetical protein
MNRKMTWSLLAAMTLCGSAAFAEQIYVKSAVVNIFSDEGSYYPVLGTATKGSALSVVSHDGHWVQVQAQAPAPAQPIQGYVFDDALQADQPPADIFNGVKVTPLISASSAGRTLQPGTVEFAQSKNINPEALQALEKYNASIDADTKGFLDFAKQGQVGIGQVEH